MYTLKFDGCLKIMPDFASKHSLLQNMGSMNKNDKVCSINEEQMQTCDPEFKVKSQINDLEQ